MLARHPGDLDAQALAEAGSNWTVPDLVDNRS
jgi:hypothetical protein